MDFSEIFFVLYYCLILRDYITFNFLSASCYAIHCQYSYNFHDVSATFLTLPFLSFISGRFVWEGSEWVHVEVFKAFPSFHHPRLCMSPLPFPLTTAVSPLAYPFPFTLPCSLFSPESCRAPSLVLLPFSLSPPLLCHLFLSPVPASSIPLLLQYTPL